MKPEDVPDDLILAGLIEAENDGRDRLEDFDGDNIKWLQYALCAVLPEHERQVRAESTDVPEELVDAIASVLDDDAHEGCGDEPCPGNVRPYYESVVRAALPHGLAERDRRVRAKVAAEIEAAAPECTVLTGAQAVHRAQGMHHAARIARGETR